MKLSTLFASIVMTGSLAAACPNLTGKYVCEPPADAGNLPSAQETITQSVENGVTVYTVVDTLVGYENTSRFTFVADGQTRENRKTDKGTGQVSVHAETFTCVDDTVHAVSEFKKEPDPTNTIEREDMTMSLSALGDLHYTWEDRTFENGAVVQQSTGSQTCKRMN